MKIVKRFLKLLIYAILHVVSLREHAIIHIQATDMYGFFRLLSRHRHIRSFAWSKVVINFSARKQPKLHGVRVIVEQTYQIKIYIEPAMIHFLKAY